MATYDDIRNAFWKHCEDSWELRDKAFGVGRAIFSSVNQRGKFPKRVFNPHPPNSETLDTATNFTPFGAMEYDAKRRIWELGTYLDVRKEPDDLSPREFLRLTFSIRQTATEYTVGLVGSDISASFLPNDTPETIAIIEGFADKVLEEIVKHYSSGRDRWLEKDEERVIGFHQR